MSASRSTTRSATSPVVRRRRSRVVTTGNLPQARRSTSKARRMASASSASPGGRSGAGHPPPVTYSCTRIAEGRGDVDAIPVLDLMGGRVVQGLRGERQHYHAVRSALVAGSDPLTIARALCLECDGRALYLSLIHISEPTRLGMISYAVFCLK